MLISALILFGTGAALVRVIMKTELIVTVTPTNPARYATATFTWTAGANCDVVAIGWSDSEINAMIQAKVHEGASAPGYSVDLSWGE